MLTKKEQRLRRARQTRVRIATARRGPPDGEPHQPAHLRRASISGDGSKVLATRVHGREAEVRKQTGGPARAATSLPRRLIGKRIAEKAKAAGVEKVAFDRSGFAYHGRVKALADAAREAGLQF